MKQIFYSVIFLALSATVICGQQPFRYKGRELKTAEMFWRTAARVSEEWKKNNPSRAGEKKGHPDVLMLLQNCVRLFPDDFLCNEKFLKEYEARGKERGFGGTSEYTEAKKYLTRAFGILIRQDPKNSYKYFARGLQYFEEKKYELALDDFSNTIKFSKTPDAGYHNFRARTYRALNKQDLAIADYKKALSIRPNG